MSSSLVLRLSLLRFNLRLCECAKPGRIHHPLIVGHFPSPSSRAFGTVRDRGSWRNQITSRNDRQSGHMEGNCTLRQSASGRWNLRCRATPPPKVHRLCSFFLCPIPKTLALHCANVFVAFASRVNCTLPKSEPRQERTALDEDGKALGKTIPPVIFVNHLFPPPLTSTHTPTAPFHA